MTKKLTLTKKEAIAECKKMWKEIEKSGLSKTAFLFDSDAGKYWRMKNYRAGCPLCEYAAERAGELKMLGRCQFCPLETKYHQSCFQLGFYPTAVHEPRFLEAVRNL